MTNKNDEKILQLKKVVEEKRNKLEELKSLGSSYKTKLVFDFDGIKYNLHVCTKEALIFIYLKLSMYEKEAKAQGMEFTIETKPVSDWLEDIKTKLRINEIKLKEAQLKTFELALDKKLSEETKNKIDIDNIGSQLDDFKI